MPTSRLDILIDIQSRLKGLTDAQKGLAGLRADAGRLGSFLGGIAQFAAGNLLSAGIMQMGAAMRQASVGGVQFNATIEQQTIAFKALLGSLGQAQRRITELTKFAAETPFELPEIVQANKQLQVLTGGALASADGMRLVGDAAAVTGKPISEVAMWVGRLYGGLQNGQPIGEATMRLTEMGLISGQTRQELENLQASGVVGGEAWAVAEKALGRFGGAMKEQARTFSGLMSTMKDNLNMAAGVAMEPVFEALKRSLQSFVDDTGPLDRFAKNVRAYLDLAFAAFKDGTLGELISLTLAAGAEQGFKAVGELLDNTLFNGKFWARVVSEWTTFSVRVAELLLRALKFPLDYIQGGFVYLIDNVLQGLRLLKDAAAAIFTGDFARAKELMANPVGNGYGAMGWDEAFKAGAEVSDGMVEANISFLRERLALTKELLGTEGALTDAINGEGSATERLLALIARYRKAREDADKAKAGDATGAAATGTGGGQSKTNIREFLLQERLELAQLRAASESFQNDWRVTEANRFKGMLVNYRQEYDLLNAMVKKLQERAAIEQDPATREQLWKEAEALNAEALGVRGKAQGMGPDPSALFDQIGVKYTEMMNQFGTFAQNLGNLVMAPFQGMAQSMSQSIQGLIEQTMSWGDAWRNVVRGMVSSVIQAFSQMVANIIAKMILQFTVGKALQAMAIAGALPMALAATAMWATPAFLASVATGGGAVVAGSGALQAGQAVNLASSLALTGGGMFAEGGFTGSGGKHEPAGIVHKGEYVFSAADVSRIGLGAIQSFRSSAPAAPAAAITGGAGGWPGSPGSLIVVDSRREAARMAENSQNEAFIVDVVKRNRGYFMA